MHAIYSASQRHEYEQKLKGSLVAISCRLTLAGSFVFVVLAIVQVRVHDHHFYSRYILTYP